MICVQGWRWVDQSPFNYNFWSAQHSFSSYPCIYLKTSGKISIRHINPSLVFSDYQEQLMMRFFKYLRFQHTIWMNKCFLLQPVGPIITVVMDGRPSAWRVLTAERESRTHLTCIIVLRMWWRTLGVLDISDASCDASFFLPNQICKLDQSLSSGLFLFWFLLWCMKMYNGCE